METDTRQVDALLRGRRVLVTGAGGSIGSELCRQISRSHPKEIVLLGHGENSIFEITNELRREVGRQGRPGREPAAGTEIVYHPVIADVRDAERVRAVLAAYRPDIVFHAAAHKHVPLMEANVDDAITNNVAGTRCLVDACLAAGGRPVRVHLHGQGREPHQRHGRHQAGGGADHPTGCPASPAAVILAVRFGNVLGSRGSVVPFFQRQIAAGGPVTVTHPDVRRYFMTIPEAVQLVLQAAAMGRGGEVFVLDMGEPIRIEDLAKDLIRLSGLEPGRDIDIVFTGLRPGEKLSEELFAKQEAYARTHHEKIFVCRNGDSLPATRQGTLDGNLDALVAAAREADEPGVRRLLSDLLPGFPATASGAGESAGQDARPSDQGTART